MSFKFPTLRVGLPLIHENLSVFPLLQNPPYIVSYRLAQEAVADQPCVMVEEMNVSGSVPQLIVKNRSDNRVLFLEGEALVGAKQDRILNASVLVAASCTVKIPVSCVEQGRWRYRSNRSFTSGDYTPLKLHANLKRSVSQSVKRGRGHSSCQTEVWNEVEHMQKLHCVSSPTGAMKDVFDGYRKQINQLSDRLQYVEGATGLALAVGSRVVAVNSFDHPETCRKVWDRLLSGIVFDALRETKYRKRATVSDVERLLSQAAQVTWDGASAIRAWGRVSS